ncbi:Holliday junction branch migration protein RuvA [bacterium]|nr:Holliday junction branch migration protein RuvA [bacterium]
MIRKLTGKVADKTDNSVVVDVGGVGYLVFVSNSASLSHDQEVSLWTHLAVRENALDLYGFSTLDELDVFNLLIGLPKVGPKSAAQILGQADISLLKKAVSENDPSYLSKMSGIGKKSAEKIVLGLKDKMDDIITSPTSIASEVRGFQSETIDALITLGYPEKEARDAVKNLPPEITDTNSALKIALRQLSS